MKISKKWKNCQDMLSFYTSVPKIMIIWCTVPEIWHVTDVIVLFLSFWAIFCPFTLLTWPKNWKKKPGDIIILHKCTKNHDYMLYCSWDMARDGCNCCFSFWAIFCPLPPPPPPPNSPKNLNFKKMKKKYLELWLDDVWFLRYGARRTDG